MPRPRTFAAAILLTLLTLTGCSDAPVVTVVNQSTTTLSNVYLTGSGFFESIAVLSPGATHECEIHPIGESGLRVEFDADGRHISSGNQGYFEPNRAFRITAIISNTFDVVVTSELKTP